ncbi:hypothetical protein C2E31_08955 [Rhodopirellula baltica]|nr:hypothetical protein C2E31_08955 [Rhodopirellula baltica]
MQRLRFESEVDPEVVIRFLLHDSEPSRIVEYLNLEIRRDSSITNRVECVLKAKKEETLQVFDRMRIFPDRIRRCADHLRYLAVTSEDSNRSAELFL